MWTEPLKHGGEGPALLRLFGIKPCKNRTGTRITHTNKKRPEGRREIKQ